MTEHTTREALDAGLAHVRDAPGDGGTLDLVVRRPGEGRREVVTEAELDPAFGLVGDDWADRPGAELERQLTIMGSRAVGLLAEDSDRWPLAGDQLYVDLDISHGNLPAGTRLAIGTAVVEVTAPPHSGCAKFSQRFGVDALRWVNSPEGKQLRLRGLNARVVQGGVVRVGDEVRKSG